MALSVRQRIEEEYPTLSWLLRDKEIGKLLTQAVDPNKGFSPTTFQAKLYQTNWWRTRSKSRREGEILYHTDPAEWRRQFDSKRAQINQMAGSMGAQLDPTRVRRWARSAILLGQEVDGPEMRWAISRAAKITPKTPYQTGQFQTDIKNIRAMTEGEFFIRTNDRASAKYARNILAGRMTVDDVKTVMMTAAAQRYPHLRPQITQGMTPGEIVAPYRQIVAEELELGDPGRVDVTRSPIWRQLLGIRDPKTRKVRLPTESEVIKLARSQPEYWKTDRGQQADAGMANSLLQMFGKRAGAGGG